MRFSHVLDAFTQCRAKVSNFTIQQLEKWLTMFLEGLMFTNWSNWSDCSDHYTVRCADGVRTRSRTCQSRCVDVSSTDIFETEVCNGAVCPGKLLSLL